MTSNADRNRDSSWTATPDVLNRIASRTQGEVFHAHAWGMAWGEEVITALKVVAAASPRQRARLCMHPEKDSSYQEMLIVMAHGVDEQPQRRTTGFDTKIVLEGSADLEYFLPEGEPSRTVRLDSDAARYVHTLSDEYHRIRVRTEWFVFLEIVLGPFDDSTTEFAPWSQVQDVTIH